MPRKVRDEMDDRNFHVNEGDVMTEEARRKAASENLARRRQELRKQKKRRRVAARLILPGLILALILMFVIVRTLRSNHTERNEKTAEAVEKSKTEGEIIIGLKGSQVQLVLKGDPYIENGAFAIDTENGAIDQDEIKIKGKVDTETPGDYEVKYIVRDGWSKITATRTVRVLSKKEFGDKAKDVPVLMYHWVYTKKKVPKELDANWILKKDLDKQMAYLEENEFYYPGWKELRAWVDGEISIPAKCVVVTFDDGKKEFLKYGIPVLEKHHVPATSFMICWEDNDALRKLKKYASPYVDFESHTYAMHQKTTNNTGYKGVAPEMKPEEISADLAKAREVVGTNDAFAYPYGELTDDLVDAVRDQGFQCAVTTEYDRVRQGADPMKLPRVRVIGDGSFESWKASVY